MGQAFEGPRLNEPAPGFNGEHHPWEAQAVGLREQVVDPVLAPRRLHAGVHHGVHLASTKAYPEFQKLGCEHLGSSIDSTYTPIVWDRRMAMNFDVDTPFPIIEDLSMTVAHAYGMIQPGASDTAAGRSTFFLESRVLRGTVHYPMGDGRSIPEFVRLQVAMQTSD
ncbi:MAG: redoxin domain-containing protein [Trueperaceae bacterium]|nr:redoxin domain-containing protein [Trueperaceae bacterium]